MARSSAVGTQKTVMQIAEQFQQEEKQKANGICTVMKYSFADLRDIIKGTDLWDQSKDAERLQENFKIIYGKIKGTLGAKYARDDPPYTNLRQNWWEAMKCRIPELRAVPDKQGYLRHKLECS
ncbi:hypothetical protein PFHG_05409 [Plasmodium falciparum HB3]|uniref:Duffy-antigen binding domain-containing protein n=1 Tax=Plasmodium falciparum (isolate HB3) TaxID=137071 RepID=A0A0L7KM37_PLAFX|nr:hypothetical protein PFHG_05409 [Plasmodium falciparum HB3]